jgi:hypothetical protein
MELKTSMAELCFLCCAAVSMMWASSLRISTGKHRTSRGWPTSSREAGRSPSGVYLLEDAQVLKIGFEHEFLLSAAGLSHARSFELAPRLGYDDPLSWQLASAIYEELTGFADEIPSFLTITDEAATSSGT